ncbi:MAG: hypothetical protein K5866_02920 [Treponema sp.]|nr:hypothetical protein [Treponema sp.]
MKCVGAGIRKGGKWIGRFAEWKSQKNLNLQIGKSAFHFCDSLSSIEFGDTSNWYCTYDVYSWKNKTDGEKIDLSDPSKNAEILTITYSDKYWYKK